MENLGLKNTSIFPMRGSLDARIPNAEASGILGASDLTRTGDLLITSAR